MFVINDAAKAKKSARALETFLKKQGLNLGLGQAYNALAAMAGFEDWNGFHAKLAQAPAAVGAVPNIWDVDFEKVDIINVFGADYTLEGFEDLDVREWLSDWDNAENPFRTGNPIALRLESQNEDVYGSAKLRVKELLSFKWDAKQQCFVSPEQGRMSLYELAPYQFKDSAKAEVPGSQEVGEQQSAKHELTILDVDFSRVTGMKKGGEGFWVDSRHYPESLAWLRDWDNPANKNDPDVPVLELTYIDDHGFAAHTQILANELLALKWSPSLGAFVSPDGVEYAFTAEQSLTPGTLPRCLPVIVKSKEVELAPTRYEVEVYSIESDEETCSGREHVETWVGVAFTVQEAESKALAEVWDASLEASAAAPSCDVREVQDEEGGPFEILVPEGHSGLKSYQSFSEAWRHAKNLFEQRGRSPAVEISDGDGAQVYRFKK